VIVRLLIRTKEDSLPHLTHDHDRDEPFWYQRWRDYLMEGSSAQQARGDGWVVVLAERSTDLVGFAAYHHTRRWQCDAELEALYVRSGDQARGVGTALLWEVVERLRRDGSRSLCVGYDINNPYKRFYRKHGAVEVNPFWAVWRELPQRLAPQSPTGSDT
jgi:GNAT superfamily N-acetyltransferase